MITGKTTFSSGIKGNSGSVNLQFCFETFEGLHWKVKKFIFCSYKSVDGPGLFWSSNSFPSKVQSSCGSGKSFI